VAVPCRSLVGLRVLQFFDKFVQAWKEMNQIEAAKPLCDLCVRTGDFNSIMQSYQALDGVLDTKVGVPYHCESGSHERVYHAYDGYTSPFEGTPSKATENLCRYCEDHSGKFALFISAATSPSEVLLRCPYCERDVLGSLP
jgi:hypothetical protein